MVVDVLDELCRWMLVVNNFGWVMGWILFL